MMWAIGIASGVFVATLISLEIGFRWGTRDAHRAELTHEGIGAIEASAFAMLGLLLGFSFAGAHGRLESKRNLIVEEANSISTAYLRVDLLPVNAQHAIRQQYKRLVDARLQAYEHRGNPALAREDFTAVARAQQEIWTLAVRAVASDPDEVTPIVLTSINEMMDIGAARSVALQTYLPPLIVGFLVASAVLSGLLAGYSMAKRRTRSWFHLTVYAGLVALTLYVVLDLDHPRFGLINLGAAYEQLKELQSTIK